MIKNEGRFKSGIWNSRMHLIPTGPSPSQGGTCENFDRDARVIILGLKFTKMSFFLGFAKLASFFGVENIAVIILSSLKICIIFLGY